MKLSAYLQATGESDAAFARRSGVPQTTVSRVRRGGIPRGDTLAQIIRATRDEPTAEGGTVTLDDLAPREPQAESAA